MLDVKVKRLSNTAILPTYGSTKAAGADLYADIGGGGFIVIPPHKTVKIGCGFAFQPPSGYCGLIFARSGLATKNGLAPANKVGVCDEDYTGEYIIPLHNHNDAEYKIKHGDRIAQLLFVPYNQAHFILADELDETDRNSNGFGSSGL